MPAASCSTTSSVPLRVVRRLVPPRARLLDESVVAQALPRAGAHRAQGPTRARAGDRRRRRAWAAPCASRARRRCARAPGLVTVAAHPHSLGGAGGAARTDVAGGWTRPAISRALLERADRRRGGARPRPVAVGAGAVRRGAGRRQAAGRRCRCAQPAGAAARGARDDWVLTPHPGEAARLLGIDGATAVQADRLAAARELQARYGGTVVLKGAGSLIVQRRTTSPGSAIAAIPAWPPPAWATC